MRMFEGKNKLSKGECLGIKVTWTTTDAENNTTILKF
jgi:hypothetical protein